MFTVYQAGTAACARRVALVVLVCLFSPCLVFPSGAADEVLTLMAPSGVAPDAACRVLADGDTQLSRPVRLRRSFWDNFADFDPSRTKWRTHFAGSGSWPEHMYWGGPNSNIKRQLQPNGEQQIYVDPAYRGLASAPLGLNPFAVSDGRLRITASQTPAELKPVLFDNAYVSGLLISKGLLEQKHGFFEVRARVPFGEALWPAFWLLPLDGWPPEIDVFEGRGSRVGTFAMTAHWKANGTSPHRSCGVDVRVPDASRAFHDYGVLWEENTITHYVDRKPVAVMPTPPGLDQPMYMLIQLAIGGKLGGVGPVTPRTPETATLEIEWVRAFQLD